MSLYFHSTSSFLLTCSFNIYLLWTYIPFPSPLCSNNALFSPPLHHCLSLYYNCQFLCLFKVNCKQLEGRHGIVFSVISSAQEICLDGWKWVDDQINETMSIPQGLGTASCSPRGATPKSWCVITNFTGLLLSLISGRRLGSFHYYRTGTGPNSPFLGGFSSDSF